jgi:hypothetical protein
VIDQLPGTVGDITTQNHHPEITTRRPRAANSANSLSHSM